MATKLAFCNQKGGTGKTTTAVNLAAALARRGRSVLLVDLDAQANASRWLRADTEAEGMPEVLRGDAQLADVIQETPTGVHVAASAQAMIAAETALGSDPTGAQFALREALTGTGGYDYILIDCPAALGIVTVNGLVAADGVIIPVLTESLSVEGLAMLRDTIAKVQSRLNPDLRIYGILICRADARRRITKDIETLLRDRFPTETLKTVIRENVRLSEAPAAREPIMTYAPNSRGAEDYSALAEEIDG